MTIRIVDIDLTAYQNTPMLPVEGTLALCDDLADARPEVTPIHVDKALTRMQGTADAIRQALIDKIEIAGVALGAEVAFDNACDRFWSASRRRLEYQMLYELDGLELLDDEEQAKLDLEHKRELAELARELDKHLFGDNGLNFLKKPFAQQAVLMASRLGFIAKSDKADAYEEVLGSDLLETLIVLQGRYEAMVRDRAVRDDSTANLRSLRQELQRHIQLYASAVLTMLDEDEPNSVEIVLDALRPMVNARARRPRPNEEPDDEPVTEAEAQVADAPEADEAQDFDDDMTE